MKGKAAPRWAVVTRCAACREVPGVQRLICLPALGPPVSSPPLGLQRLPGRLLKPAPLLVLPAVLTPDVKKSESGPRQRPPAQRAVQVGRAQLAADGDEQRSEQSSWQPS